ncbi:MAG: cellulase family glycosylhydrolase, partial [Oscillospiraceae bacterium]
LDNGMYVILNVHHNDLQTLVSTDTSVQARVNEELTAIWTQIAEHFKSYGDKLIFEVNNEPRGTYSDGSEDWNGNDDFYTCVNTYNETARAAIRATGGNNASRLITMPTYCASADESKLNLWEKNDSDNMLAVSLHAYLPFDFAFESSGHSDWQASDEAELDSLFARVYSHFVSQGIPVIMDEFGAVDKSNTSDREKWAEYYISAARQFAAQDIPCVLWDNNVVNTSGENFGYYNRNDRSFYFPTIVKAIVDAYNGDPAAETSTEGKTVLFEGSMSLEAYANTGFDSSAVTTLASDGTIVARYNSDNPPEFVLQSWETGYECWTKVNPDSYSDGTAVWSKSTLVSAYPYENLAHLNKVYVGATNSDLTLTEVFIPTGEAHTHNYNGATEITIPATATTKGRQIVHCSADGCDAVKVSVIPATGNGSETENVVPQNVSAVGGISNITVSWDKVNGAEKYRIQRLSGSTWKTIDYSTTNSYTDSNVGSGVTYSYRVLSYVGGKWSAVSAVASAAPTVSYIPGNVQAVGGCDNVTLTWNSAYCATRYRVQRLNNNVWSTIGYSTSNSYTDTNVTLGTTYSYRVLAFADGVWSSVSETASAAPTSSVIPQNVSANGGAGFVSITWDSVSGAQKYRVQRLNGSTWSTISYPTSCSFSDETVAANTTYSYRVLAMVGGNWGGTSAVVSAAPTASYVPANLKAVGGAGKVVLTWDTVQGAQKYRVQRLNNSVWTTISTPTDASYTDNTVTAGTTYSYRVLAMVGGNWYAASAAVSAAPTASTIPANVSAKSSNGKITVSWDAVANAQQYRVQRLNGSVWSSIGYPTENSFTDDTAAAGTTYSYRVLAKVDGEWSGVSAVVTAAV